MKRQFIKEDVIEMASEPMEDAQPLSQQGSAN